jgi:hypothetical protein
VHGEVADRGFRLDVDVVDVVVDLERGLGRVGHLPDDHRRDLDRVAVLVVDLHAARLEVAHADAQLGLQVEGVDPPPTGLARRSLVGAEEHEHARLVRVDEHQPVIATQLGREQQERHDRAADRLVRRGFHEPVARRQHRQREHREGQPAVYGFSLDFVDHQAHSSGTIRYQDDITMIYRRWRARNYFQSRSGYFL